MGRASNPPLELRPTNRRIEAFSDGVFAIVITIMVIGIQIPNSFAVAMEPQTLREFGSVILAYALSFYIIANLWTSHHYLLFTISHPSRVTIWFNNLLLFCISLLPLVTRFLGMHPWSAMATAAYGLAGAAATGSFMLLRAHASRTSHNAVHRDIHSRVLRRAAFFFAIYVVAIPLGFVSPLLAWACFGIVPPMLFLPIIRASAGLRKDDANEEHALKHSCP